MRPGTAFNGLETPTGGNGSTKTDGSSPSVLGGSAGCGGSAGNGLGAGGGGYPGDGTRRVLHDVLLGTGGKALFNGGLDGERQSNVYPGNTAIGAASIALIEAAGQVSGVFERL
jgi:hypothetical protein